ncbi:hypothetical protein B0H11DRAFT_1913343 [Mycena galericulata]|nr:hypothetical protein B0H11DRAFT_1913343 [Mycena galericulata]
MAVHDFERREIAGHERGDGLPAFSSFALPSSVSEFAGSTARDRVSAGTSTLIPDTSARSAGGTSTHDFVTCAGGGGGHQGRKTMRRDETRPVTAPPPTSHIPRARKRWRKTDIQAGSGGDGLPGLATQKHERTRRPWLRVCIAWGARLQLPVGIETENRKPGAGVNEARMLRCSKEASADGDKDEVEVEMEVEARHPSAPPVPASRISRTHPQAVRSAPSYDSIQRGHTMRVLSQWFLAELFVHSFEGACWRGRRTLSSLKFGSRLSSGVLHGEWRVGFLTLENGCLTDMDPDSVSIYFIISYSAVERTCAQTGLFGLLAPSGSVGVTIQTVRVGLTQPDSFGLRTYLRRVRLGAHIHSVHFANEDCDERFGEARCLTLVLSHIHDASAPLDAYAIIRIKALGSRMNDKSNHIRAISIVKTQMDARHGLGVRRRMQRMRAKAVEYITHSGDNKSYSGTEKHKFDETESEKKLANLASQIIGQQGACSKQFYCGLCWRDSIVGHSRTVTTAGMSSGERDLGPRSLSLKRKDTADSFSFNPDEYHRFILASNRSESEDMLVSKDKVCTLNSNPYWTSVFSDAGSQEFQGPKTSLSSRRTIIRLRANDIIDAATYGTRGTGAQCRGVPAHIRRPSDWGAARRRPSTRKCEAGAGNTSLWSGRVVLSTKCKAPTPRRRCLSGSRKRRGMRRLARQRGQREHGSVGCSFAFSAAGVLRYSRAQRQTGEGRDIRDSGARLEADVPPPSARAQEAMSSLLFIHQPITITNCKLARAWTGERQPWAWAPLGLEATGEELAWRRESGDNGRRARRGEVCACACAVGSDFSMGEFDACGVEAGFGNWKGTSSQTTMYSEAAAALSSGGPGLHSSTGLAETRAGQ